MAEIDAPALLREMMEAAITAADPAQVLARHLPPKPQGRCIVLGAGKAAASMAAAVEQAWPDVDLSGLVVTRYGHAVPLSRIELREAAHPVPDANGLRAAEDIMRLARSVGPNDLVLALISGGGSSLLPLPEHNLTLEDEIAVNRLLLKSGLAIDEMNRVRRRLSRIKGGKLAEACTAGQLVTLAISDVPGDDPRAIASGPTVHDPEAGRDLGALAERLGPDLPEAARKLLCSTPAPQKPFDADYRMIATPQMSLEAAAAVARARGVTPVLLGDALEGEASALGTVMAGMVQSVRRHSQPAKPPMVLLSGGETTVTIGKGPAGRGGRNTEFLLSLAIALNGLPGCHALAVDTDGIDGTEDAAGALIGPDTLVQMNAAGYAPRAALDGHDSYSAFARTGALIKTGPTLTNVNDFRAVLVT